MKRLLTAILPALAALASPAETLFPAQMLSISQNNGRLQLLGTSAEAARAEALSGLSLPNPEISVGYLWGVPKELPGETDVEVSQSFDFATLSGAKSRNARAEAALADSELALSRTELLMQAEQEMIGNCFLRQLLALQAERMTRLEQMLVLAREQAESGIIGLTELNELELTLLEAAQELEATKSELALSSMQLQLLNGGEPLNLPSEMPTALIPSDFEAWIKGVAVRSGELNLLRARVEKSGTELALRKKERLPDFSISYIGQMTPDDDLHGFAFTFSVPLWAGRGRVKAAKAAQTAALMELADNEVLFRQSKLRQFEQTRLLHNSLMERKALLARLDSSSREYLDLALKNGKITHLDYLCKLDELHAHRVKTLEMHRDFLLSRTDLYAETLNQQ